MKFLRYVLVFVLSLGLISLNSCDEEEVLAPTDVIVPVATLSLEELNSNFETYLGQLVVLTGVEFVSPQSRVFNHANETVTGLRTLTDCSGNTIDVLTMADRFFANETLPTGHGNLTVVVEIFGDSPQLLLRGAADWVGLVGTENARCTPLTFSGGVVGTCEDKTGNYTNICFLRTLYAGDEEFLDNGTIIRGVVTSDKDAANINNQNLYLEDGTAGIQIRFTEAHNYNVGDELEIDISNGSLGDFNSSVQIQNIEPRNVSVIASNQPLTPTVITIAQALTGDYRGRLVTIENVSFSPTGGTYAGNRDITDGTNTMVLRTGGGASFENETVPDGNVKVTGNIGIFNTTIQLYMRNVADVE